MNHTAHSPRSSGSTEQDTLVPACRHRRHLGRSAGPRPAVTTGATRRWDGEHRDAPRVQDSRHHITTSSPRRAPRDVNTTQRGRGTNNWGGRGGQQLSPFTELFLSRGVLSGHYFHRYGTFSAPSLTAVIRHRAETRIAANPRGFPRAHPRLSTDGAPAEPLIGRFTAKG